MNLATWVERHGRRRPGEPALAAGERVHADWGTFAGRVAGVAAGLRDDLGLSPGDRVAILMRNRPEYLEALFGAWHAGLVVVPINARLHRDEVAFIVDASGAAAVFTDPEHADDVVGPSDVVVAPGTRWDRLVGAEHAPLAPRRSDDPAWLFFTSAALMLVTLGFAVAAGWAARSRDTRETARQPAE